MQQCRKIVSIEQYTIEPPQMINMADEQVGGTRGRATTGDLLTLTQAINIARS